MSLAYFLFGEPRTVDDFIDKAKRYNDTTADVSVQRSTDGDTDWGTFDRHFDLRLKSANAQLTLPRLKYEAAVYHAQKERIHRIVLEDAKTFAKVLALAGLEATVEGKPLYEFRTA
jgi:hypothetical protein